jgi:hypothetical protein
MAAMPPAPQPQPTSQLIEPAFKSVVDLSIEVYRQMGLMHGGAIIAILTFLGHSGTRYPAAPLFVSLSLFALGLWFNVESMGQTRQLQTCLFNREHMRMWAFHQINAGQIAQATETMNKAAAFNTQHEEHALAAMRLVRASLGTFIAGSGATLFSLVSYVP